MKYVWIMERRSGRVVAIYPIQFGGIDRTPTSLDYENQAWAAALDDRKVDADRRDDYLFQISDA